MQRWPGVEVCAANVTKALFQVFIMCNDCIVTEKDNQTSISPRNTESLNFEKTNRVGPERKIDPKTLLVEDEGKKSHGNIVLTLTQILFNF